MKFKFFQRGDNQVVGREVMAAMIEAASQGELVYEDVATSIDFRLSSPEFINPVLFGLTRATAMMLKSLKDAGYPVKDQFEAMLDVWLKDIDYTDTPLNVLPNRFLEYKRS